LCYIINNTTPVQTNGKDSKKRKDNKGKKVADEEIEVRSCMGKDGA